MFVFAHDCNQKPTNKPRLNQKKTFMRDGGNGFVIRMWGKGLDLDLVNRFGSVVRTDWIRFRLIFVRLPSHLCGLNRAGGQAGPPAPAACAKYYCYSQCPPAARRLNRTGADSLPARQPLSPRPWRLTRAIVFVGNIPNCAQGQKRKSKPCL